MNKIYIGHVSSTDLSSKVIALGSWMNGWEEINYSHTMLIYTNAEGKQIVVESLLNKGIYSMNYKKYNEDYKSSIIKTVYTPLDGLVDEKNTIEDFETFLKEKYTNGKNFYSISKALKSFKFEDLKVANWNEIFEESKKQSGQSWIQYGWNLAKNTVNSYTTAFRNNVRGAINFMGKNAVDIAGYMGKLFSKKEFDEVETLKHNEETNKNPTIGYFYCTELVITLLRDWCETRNIQLPSILKYEKINKQKPSEIYPQELFTLLREQSEQNIVEKI